MNMNIEPISIDVNVKKRFMEIAILVDNPFFIEDVKQARTNLNITLLPRSVVLKETKEKREKDSKLLSKPIDWKTLAKVKNYTTAIDSHITFEVVLNDELDNVIDKLLVRYHKNNNFRNVIRHSILSNEVKDEDFLAPYLKEGTHSYKYSDASSTFIVIPDGDKPETLLSLDPWEVAIIVNPLSTQKEIKDVFNSFKKTYKRILRYWKNPDTIGNIKRDRKWYWQKQSGMSYSQIHRIAEAETEIISQDGIVKAIKQYKKLIQMNKVEV